METTITRRELYIKLERAGAALANALQQLTLDGSEVPSAATRDHLDGLRRTWDLARGRVQQAGHLTGDPKAKGFRPAHCDQGAVGSRCCDGGCQTNIELAELSGRRATDTAAMKLQELKALAEAATAGPWSFSRDTWNIRVTKGDLYIGVYAPFLPDSDEVNPNDMTGEFIAACDPQTILALLADRAAMAERLSQLEEAIGRQAVEHGSFPAQHKGGEPEHMSTDESREYLIAFMEQHFTDKTYHRYIRGKRGAVNLAGDFAWQLARALRMLAEARRPASLPEADALRDSLEQICEGWNMSADLRKCLESALWKYNDSVAALKGQANG